MAVVQRMQKSCFGNPAPFFDDDAVHDRDLPGRAAEAQQSNAQPHLEGFGKLTPCAGATCPAVSPPFV